MQGYARSCKVTKRVNVTNGTRGGAHTGGGGGGGSLCAAGTATPQHETFSRVSASLENEIKKKNSNNNLKKLLPRSDNVAYSFS